MNAERFQEGNDETRTGGLLKLLPHWLYRNRFWHLNFMQWLETPEANQALGELFIASDTITLLGRLELEGEPVSMADYASRALPVAREMGYPTEGLDGEQLQKRMHDGLLGSVKLGYVVQDGDNIKLSSVARKIFIISEAIGGMADEEEKLGNN